MNIENIVSAVNYIGVLVNSVQANQNLGLIQKYNTKALVALLKFIDESLEVIGGDVLNVVSHIERGNFKIAGSNDYIGTTASGQRSWIVTVTIPEVVLLTLKYKSSDWGGWQIDESEISTQVLADIDNRELITNEYDGALGDLSDDFAKLVEGSELTDTPVPYTPTSNENALLNVLDKWADSVNHPDEELCHLVNVDIYNGEDMTVETTLVRGAKDDEDAGIQAILAIARSDNLEWSSEGAVVSIGYPKYVINTVRVLSQFEAKLQKEHFNIQQCHDSATSNTIYAERLSLHLTLEGNELEHALNFGIISVENPVLGNYLLDINEASTDESDTGVNITCEFETNIHSLLPLFNQHKGVNGLKYNPDLDLNALLHHSKTELKFNPQLADNPEMSESSIKRIIDVTLCETRVGAEYNVIIDLSL